MGNCLIVLVSILFPRLSMIVIAIITNWFSEAYETVMWPIIGWFLMPFTTLAYMATMLNNNHEISGSWFFLICAAVFLDISFASSSSSSPDDKEVKSSQNNSQLLK